MNSLLNLVVKGSIRDFKDKVFKACDTKFADMKMALKKEVGSNFDKKE